MTNIPDNFEFTRLGVRYKASKSPNGTFNVSWDGPNFTKPAVYSESRVIEYVKDGNWKIVSKTLPDTFKFRHKDGTKYTAKKDTDGTYTLYFKSGTAPGYRTKQISEYFEMGFWIMDEEQSDTKPASGLFDKLPVGVSILVNVATYGVFKGQVIFRAESDHFSPVEAPIEELKEFIENANKLLNGVKDCNETFDAYVESLKWVPQ